MIEKVTTTTALAIIEAMTPKKLKKMVATITAKQILKYQNLISTTAQQLNKLKSSFLGRLRNWNTIKYLEGRLATLQNDLRIWINQTLRRLNLAQQITV